MSTRVIAVDWSGAKQGAHRAIRLAEVAGGRLRRVEGGRERRQVIQHLIEEGARDRDLVVGLDFAFSFPDWFLRERGLESGRDVWDLVTERGEAWLSTCEDPFWGRPGRAKPDVEAHFRETERQAQKVSGAQPKSVFQIGGAGAVGTASLRGMPHLAELADAGFSIWPFDAPGRPLVLEIFPRLLTGAVVKSDPAARRAYLERSWPEIGDDLRERVVASDDAFDAAVSAVMMARHLDEIGSLPEIDDPVVRREGWIWVPSASEAEHRRTSCPFCRVAGRQRIAESEHGVALYDAYPVTEGHALVIPRRHTASFFDLPDEAQQDVWRLAAEVRRRLADETGAADFNVGINDGPAAGQTIPHAHIHVIPRRAGDVDDPRGGIRWVRPERAVYWE